MYVVGVLFGVLGTVQQFLDSVFGFLEQFDYPFAILRVLDTLDSIRAVYDSPEGVVRVQARE